MGQEQVIKTFFVTLRRSQAGKPWFHRRVLDALGLQRRLTCVEKPNNPLIRGMLRKVAHLVVIETDQMYYNRKLAEHAAASLRPPVSIKHSTPSLSPAVQHAWQQQQQPR